MRRSAILNVFMGTLLLALAGCHSHQDRIDELQKNYDQLGQQYRQDCSSELVNVPPKLSPKCADENKKVQDAWNQLQAERAKK